MNESEPPPPKPNSGLQWLAWAKKLQALAQTGLEYTQNPFDIERYKAVARVAAEMMAAHSDVGEEQWLERFSTEDGYATPKVDVRGVVFQDGKILLVKERLDGLWTIPGGFADVGDTPSQAVVREVWEESGYEVRAVKLLAVYDRGHHPHPPFPFDVYKLFILCELTGGAPRSSIETDEIGFFAEDDIPPLSLSRILPEQIARMFDHARNPDWPTEFD